MSLYNLRKQIFFYFSKFLISITFTPISYSNIYKFSIDFDDFIELSIYGNSF